MSDQVSSKNGTETTQSLSSNAGKSELHINKPDVRISEPVVRSVAICMIRNEQDVIEPFLRHTSPLVDLIIIMDNCSTDDTRSIIRDTARELGNDLAFRLGR